MASMLRCETCNKRLSEPFFGKKRFCDRSCSASYTANSVKDLATPFSKKTYSDRYRELFKEQKGKCGICGRKKWLGKLLRFDYDHIDGNHHNNKRKNSRLLCPNCHSQTETFRGRNRSCEKAFVEDSVLVHALKMHKSIRAALLSVGLAGKGGNYIRCYKLKAKF